MSAADIPIVIDLVSGTARAEIFTCDLSYDYVTMPNTQREELFHDSFP